MGNDQQGGNALQHSMQATTQVLGIERRKAFIQDNQVGALKQSTGDVEPAAFTVRKAPAGLTNHLQQSTGHTCNQLFQAQFAADSFRLLQIFESGRPAFAHEQVEGKCLSEHMVLVKLWCGNDAPSPAVGAKCGAIQTTEQEQTGLWLPYTRQ